MVIESMKSLPLDGGGEGEEEEEEEGGFLLFLSLWADSKEILQRCLCPRIAVWCEIIGPAFNSPSGQFLLFLHFDPFSYFKSSADLITTNFN